MLVKIASTEDIKWVKANLYSDKKFPSLRNSVANLVIFEKGKIVGFVALLTIVEVAMLLKKGAKTRIKAINAVIPYGRYIIHKQGYLHFYAFVEDKKFEKILKKRYGFRDALDKCLISEV